MKKTMCGKVALTFEDTDYGTQITVDGNGISLDFDYIADEKTIIRIDNNTMESDEISPVSYNNLLSLMNGDFTLQELNQVLDSIIPIQVA